MTLPKDKILEIARIATRWHGNRPTHSPIITFTHLELEYFVSLIQSQPAEAQGGQPVAEVVREGVTCALHLLVESLPHGTKLYRQPTVPEDARDAARYRWLVSNHSMCWSGELDGSIKWVRYIPMTAPDISIENLTETSVQEHFESAIDAAIAASPSLPGSGDD